MVTKKRRVAAYLPESLEDAFVKFKRERQLGDSQALICILSEFLEVSYQATTDNLDYSSLVKQDYLEEKLIQIKSELLSELSSEVRDIEKRLDSRLLNELLSELSNKVERIEEKLEDIEAQVSKGFSLSVSELAKRLGMPASTLSHWKSSDPKRGKSLNELLNATREKDPDGIGWILDPETNRFKPERKLPGDSESVLQGNLLSAIPPAQVNPLPEGSERSGEG